MIPEGRAWAVIGAGYGDEGKGRTTDALAHRLLATGARPTVVRHNGGAQAGHTVLTPEGHRHVFHHFGSGALAGAPTHLSRFFVCHPLLFAHEREALAVLGANLQVSADPECPITTPYEVMINQALEVARGTGRHGSCGLGFGETLEREARGPALRLKDLADLDKVARILDDIRGGYLPQRLVEVGGLGGGAVLPWAADVRIRDRFLNDLARFRSDVHSQHEPMGRPTHWIFEGAQGLLLDQDRGHFPHVTRSNTGLHNAATVAREWGVPVPTPLYVTRCYRTRHGAGPLAHELPAPPTRWVEDTTNRPNAHQGALRFAPLDVTELTASIALDRSDAVGAEGPVGPHGLVVTCLDQAPEGIVLIEHGRPTAPVPPEAVAERLRMATGASWVEEGWGATRTAVRQPGADMPRRGGQQGPCVARQTPAC